MDVVVNVLSTNIFLILVRTQVPSGRGSCADGDLQEPADEAARRLVSRRKRVRRHRAEDLTGPRVRGRVAAVSITLFV